MPATSAPLLTEDEIHEVLASYEERVGEVIGKAVDRWQQMPLSHVVSFTPRTRASAIHDLIVEEATAEFLGDPNVTVSLKRGTVVLVFGGRVAIRFKKVCGRSLRYSVGPTYRQRAIHEQQLPLDGTDVRVTWATAGYRLDAAGRLAQAALVVTDGDVQQYAFDLTAPPAPVVVLPVDDEDDGLVIRPAVAAIGDAAAGTP
jgi:hypothetical protein